MKLRANRLVEYCLVVAFGLAIAAFVAIEVRDTFNASVASFEAALDTKGGR